MVVSISRLYADREIYGYFSIGLSRNDLIKFLIPQSTIFFFITLILSIYIAPYTKELSKELVSIDSFEEQLESIRPKELFSFNEKDNFIYAEDKDGNSIEDLVIYVTNKNTSSFILAKELNYQKKDKSIILNFNEGSVYQDIFHDKSILTSQFGNLRIPITNDLKTLSGLSLSKLFDFSAKSSKSEMYWNISIPITIFILLIIGVYISKVDPRQGRLSVLLPAIFVYILYLSLLILGRESFDSEVSNSHLYIWYVHLFFIIFAVFLIFKNNLISISSFLDSLKRKKLFKNSFIYFYHANLFLDSKMIKIFNIYLIKRSFYFSFFILIIFGILDSIFIFISELENISNKYNVLNIFKHVLNSMPHRLIDFIDGACLLG